MTLDRRWLVALVAVLAVGGVAYYMSQHSGGTSGQLTVSSPVTVTYKVEGTAAHVDITFEGPTGTRQQAGIPVPVVKASDHTPGIDVQLRKGGFAYISAQNTGASGNVTCIIEENGVELTRNTSTGGFTIATCSTTA